MQKYYQIKIVISAPNPSYKVKKCFGGIFFERLYRGMSNRYCTYTSESDLDFYIVVRDGITDIPAETARAYKAIRKIKQHPVDILLGTKSRFEERKGIPSVENEVYRKGVLLYDAGNQRVV